MRKIIPVVAAGATALALAGTTYGYANLNKSVTLSVDGQTTDVQTSADTVGALLKTKGITHILSVLIQDPARTEELKRDDFKRMNIPVQDWPDQVRILKV